jgi:hypothetical protein
LRNSEAEKLRIESYRFSSSSQFLIFLTSGSRGMFDIDAHPHGKSMSKRCTHRTDNSDFLFQPLFIFSYNLCAIKIFIYSFNEKALVGDN